MVKGLDRFRTAFADYPDCYLLIGGSACDLNFSVAALPFRVTRDLDLVLCVEALTPDFFNQFWRFIQAGGYEHKERSNGKPQFYRFTHPSQPDYPETLELFSRRADCLPAPLLHHLTPIPAGEEASSLSAILLNDDLYAFAMANRSEVDGVSILSPVGLIALKAIAWSDLSNRKAAGEGHIDTKNIRKHKNDIARLTLLTAGQSPEIPANIRAAMRPFLAAYQAEPLDPRALGLPLSPQEIHNELLRLFGP